MKLNGYQIVSETINVNEISVSRLKQLASKAELAKKLSHAKTAMHQWLGNKKAALQAARQGTKFATQAGDFKRAALRGTIHPPMQRTGSYGSLPSVIGSQTMIPWSA